MTVRNIFIILALLIFTSSVASASTTLILGDWKEDGGSRTYPDNVVITAEFSGKTVTVTADGSLPTNFDIKKIYIFTSESTTPQLKAQVAVSDETSTKESRDWDVTVSAKGIAGVPTYFEDGPGKEFNVLTVTSTKNDKYQGPIKISLPHDVEPPVAYDSKEYAIVCQVSWEVNGKSYSNEVGNGGIKPPGTALALNKVANPTTYSASTQTISYTYTITNYGSELISNLVINDNKITSPNTVTLDSTNIYPGATVTGTATYTLTPDDHSATSVTNTAIVSGTYISNGNSYPTSSNQAQTTVYNQVNPPVYTPGLSLVKTADITTYNKLTNTVTYTYTVKNTGEVVITDITVIDDKFGNSPLDICSSLAPGASESKSFTYILSNEDHAAASVTNTATAQGLYDGSIVPSDPAQVTIYREEGTSVPEFPSLALPVAAILGILIIFGRKNKE